MSGKLRGWMLPDEGGVLLGCFHITSCAGVELTFYADLAYMT